jgi:DNA-binding MarR family transcriptional regulator
MGTNTKSSARAMDAARHLVRALAGSARAIQTRIGISGAQLFVLRELARADAPLSVNELADQTLTHQSTVSGVVARLVERRLVTRTPSPDDARRAAVALTTRGRALLDDAPATVQSQLVAGLDRLATAQRVALADGLEAWLDAAGIDGGPAPMFLERDAAAEPARKTTRARGAGDAALAVRRTTTRRTSRSRADD